MKKRFFGLAVAAFALVFAAFAPAKAEAQTVKDTYWMVDLASVNPTAGAQYDAMGVRMYIAIQFADKQFTMGLMPLAIDDDAEGVATANMALRLGGVANVGVMGNAKTADYTQRGNTITYNDGQERTMELSNNGLNLT